MPREKQKPRLLIDGNWLEVRHENIGMSDFTVVTIKTKTQPEMPLIVFSEDEWNEMREAVANDGPRRA